MNKNQIGCFHGKMETMCGVMCLGMPKTGPAFSVDVS